MFAQTADVRFIILDPAHFHAALVQKEMYSGVSPTVAVYGPLSPDLVDYLNRIVRFNARAENATTWKLDVHTSPEFFESMLRDRPGNVVVLSGRNRTKIERIQKSIEAGLNVLADKPWILASADLAKLEASLDTARAKGLVAFDIMTERYEVTSILQRELVNDAGVFGEIVHGDREHPGVFMDSVHQILKTVAGAPNLRPAWFFDVDEQGEGLSDVGTHLIDLIQWSLFPDQGIDYRNEIEVLAGKRWATSLTRAQFQRVTGEADFPAVLTSRVQDGAFPYYCNNSVSYTIRGVHADVRALWNFHDSAVEPDTYTAVFRGTKSHVEIRQGAPEKFRPEVYVVPNSDTEKRAVAAALAAKIRALQPGLPGVGIEDMGKQFRLTIPERLRVGHEQHFAQVTQEFLRYLKDPGSVPEWERPNMAAKYYVTARGVELAREATAAAR